MFDRLLPVALAVTLLATTRLAVAAGTITGTVRLVQTTPILPLPPIPVSKDATACGKEAPNEAVLSGPGGGLRNVVVFVKGARAESKLSPIPGAALDQKRCRYSPHVQALTVGTALTLMNNDAILHNVHANEGNVTVFNLAMPIKGQTIPQTLRKPGLMKLQCDAGHAWMNAWIYVFDHPYFAVTDDAGAFVIKDVPIGEHTLELWHEPVDGKGDGVRSTVKVKVTDKALARADVTMKL